MFCALTFTNLFYSCIVVSDYKFQWDNCIHVQSFFQGRNLMSATSAMPDSPRAEPWRCTFCRNTQRMWPNSIVHTVTLSLHARATWVTHCKLNRPDKVMFIDMLFDFPDVLFVVVCMDLQASIFVSSTRLLRLERSVVTVTLFSTSATL